MRKIALLAVVALAAACGGSSTTDPAPTVSVITGTVGGSAFTSVSQLALFGSGNNCTSAVASGFKLGVSMVSGGVSDVAYTCSDVLGCVDHPTSRQIGIIIARANYLPSTSPTSATAPGIVPGSYTFLDLSNLDPTVLVPDATGNLNIFAATANGLNATCTDTPYLVSGGTLTVTSVTSTTIKGDVTMTISPATGGGTLSGTFEASNCLPTPFDACTALNGILDPSSGGLELCAGTPTCN
jgi:hypothetical protein